MRKLLLIAALLVPVASQAKVQLGLRLGFAPAIGDAAKDVKMKEFTNKSQIPIQLDALYKVNKDIGVGAYFSYGVGQVDYAGCDAADCSGSVMRFGVQGHYTVNQLKLPLVPWAGVGFGYEIAKDTIDDAGGKLETTLSGFEFLNLQVGGDYAVNEKFAVGPYLQFSVGQYSKAKFESGGASVDRDITDKAMHEWFGFGLRGKFDL
jgi:hypothetical protein